VKHWPSIHVILRGLLSIFLLILFPWVSAASLPNVSSWFWGDDYCGRGEGFHFDSELLGVN
jgi:hypothetical protein